MDTALVDRTSQTYLGQWSRLISSTNWEKGRIIGQWREALVQTEAPASEYSDDAWSRRVGNITPQHVGRLRRVHERFAAVYADYAGLYWSHFQAALDWADAEMWLEGAVQNGWSIAEMRSQRATTLGLVDEPVEKSTAGDDDEWDQDAADADGGPLGETLKEVRSPGATADDRAATQYADDDDDYGGDDRAAGDDWPSGDSSGDGEQVEAVRPFAHLPSLPPDVGEAFEAFKLCILRHKLAGWTEISRTDLLASLDALRDLARGPMGA